MTHSPSSSSKKATDVDLQTGSEKRFYRRSLRAEMGLLLFCLFLFFWRLGNAPLFDLDEALYVTCAQQMIISGDWVTPRINTRQPERPGVTAIPFFEKPILVYWASAGSMRLFDRNLWAARLPAALAALLTTLAITLFGRRWLSRRAGLLSGAVFAANPMTLVDARQMTTDGLLVLWFAVAMFCFWKVKETGESRKEKVPEGRLFSLCFWFLCALAILTKGIVGLLLPLLIIGIYLLWDRVLLRMSMRRRLGLRFRFALKLHPLACLWSSMMRLRPLTGVLLLLAVAAPWHLRIVGSRERDAQGRTWVMEYIQRQHIGRFKGLDTVHNQPLPSYFLYFIFFFYPWAGFTPAAFRTGKTEEEKRRKGEEEKREQGINTRYLQQNGMNEEQSTIHNPQSKFQTLSTLNSQLSTKKLSTFLLVWFWTLFVFFSLGAAKLPTYIAPAYPAAALLVGGWLDRVLTAETNRQQGQEQSQNARWLRRGALCAFGVALLLLLALPFAPRFVPRNAPLPVGVLPLAWHLTVAMVVGVRSEYDVSLLSSFAQSWKRCYDSGHSGIVENLSCQVGN